MQRRRMLAAVPVVALTAGCLGTLREDRVEYEAQPVAVAEHVVNQQGYQLNERDEFVIEETVDPPVISERKVVITNHAASYSLSEMDEQVSGLLVASSPQAEVAGQEVNPLGRIPLESLSDQIDEEGTSESDGESVESTEITVLGMYTEVQKIPSTTETDDGQEVETFTYVTRVAHEGDYVVALGMLPRELDQLEPSVHAMMEGIEHPA